jgi:hypothetical protein
MFQTFYSVKSKVIQLYLGKKMARKTQKKKTKLLFSHKNQSHYLRFLPLIPHKNNPSLSLHFKSGLLEFILI